MDKYKKNKKLILATAIAVIVLAIAFAAGIRAFTGIPAVPNTETSAAPKAIETFSLTPSLRNVKEFEQCLGDFDAGYDTDQCYNVTPQNISDLYGFQIFKFDTSCASFLLYEDEVYQLGGWFGGLGATSFAVADLNEDGFWELYFTYSCGSGVHASSAGYFNAADKTVTLFENSFISADGVLTTGSDGSLRVCLAEYEGDSFSALKPIAGEQIAVILWEEAQIALIPETEEGVIALLLKNK